MAKEEQTNLEDIFNDDPPADDDQPGGQPDGETGDDTGTGDQHVEGGDQGGDDTPPEPTFIDRMRDAGFQDVPDDESEARDRLLDAFTSGRETLEQLNSRIQQLEQMNAATASMIQRMTPPPQQQPPAQTSPWPQIPAVDLARWQQYQTENGWRDDTPQSIRDQYAEFEQAAQDWTRRLLYSPSDALRDPIRHEVASFLEETFGVPANELPNRMDLDGRQAYADRMYEAAEPFLYQVNPLTKQPDQNKLTEYGQVFADAMRECSEFAKRFGGQASTADQIEFAYRKTEGMLASLRDQSANHNAQNTRQQRQQEHRQQTRGGRAASGGTNRTGSVPNKEGLPSSGGGNLSNIGMEFADALAADGGLS